VTRPGVGGVGDRFVVSGYAAAGSRVTLCSRASSWRDDVAFAGFGVGGAGEVITAEVGVVTIVDHQVPGACRVPELGHAV